MIFGDCNLKIINLYPRIDRNSVGDYYFSVGIKKEFAKKCFEEELTKKGRDKFQKIGENMIKKPMGLMTYFLMDLLMIFLKIQMEIILV